ncbi:cell wall metabolism sensor histidine kinase WalK [Thomasclavelia sp.]|uniref:sensor histidine kinase n=1 Tax=Thomasclavelia sp. TaxID=3025757 RepID=UPI0026002D64|nr:HAMP domain-containing sensor histidine kinase [Thomasclavelia sp.]
MKTDKRPSRFFLTIFFTLIIFISFIITILITGIIFMLVFGVDFNAMPKYNGVIVLVHFAIISVIVGMIVSFLISRLPLKPANTLIEKINTLANGDFSVRLSLKHFKFARDLSYSFNKLAEELENTEMLRADFINDFSHEFKTPIVSIQGFAKLLQNEQLDEVTMKKYLKIIETESNRLAKLANNILELKKVENQTILTNVTNYNLSEQVRNCILLLADKWEAKNLVIDVNFEEYQINGNKELLQEVWVNLMDNAVKYSPENNSIEVAIVDQENQYAISFTNHGVAISPKDQKYIYNKFYQGDSSHATSGNGTGLAIVKKIITLHNGEILLNSDDQATTFTIILPK